MGNRIGVGAVVVASLWGVTSWLANWILLSWDCFENRVPYDSFQCSQTANSLAIGMVALSLLASLVLAGFVLWALLDVRQRKRAARRSG